MPSRGIKPATLPAQRSIQLTSAAAKLLVELAYT